LKTYIKGIVGSALVRSPSIVFDPGTLKQQECTTQSSSKSTRSAQLSLNGPTKLKSTRKIWRQYDSSNCGKLPARVFISGPAPEREGGGEGWQ